MSKTVKATTSWQRGLSLSLATLVCAAGLGSTAAFAAPTPTTDDGVMLSDSTVRTVADEAPVDQFIVGFTSGPANTKASERAKAWGVNAKLLGITAKEVRTLATGATLVKTDRALNAAEAKSFMDSVKASSAVAYVEPDAIMQPLATANDTYYQQYQWDFHGTWGQRVPGAWDKSTGAGVTVAVIDTGIVAHPDLDANIVPGYDFISSSTAARDGNGRDANPQDQGDWTTLRQCAKSGPAAQPSDSSWHGTHVAGTVAAVTNNSSGVAGVAYGAKVQPVRALGACGGSLSDIADAIVWASGGTVPGIPANTTPAQVINMSLGGSGTCDATYQNAINGAVARGTTVVVAAGNSNADAGNFRPASCQNVITVAASSPAGTKASYSNYGAVVDVTAPGGEMSTSSYDGILSTLNDGATTPGAPVYSFYQGTSMAAPHVAAQAALLKAYNTTLTPAQIEANIKSTARPLAQNFAGGTGLVDATASLLALG